ncbi:MAG: hypothetical protein M1839_008679 [Geoglossum umbratile]|nr:MAG: hypothetical protein M1839_008679 [Geoglossum umbratile]
MRALSQFMTGAVCSATFLVLFGQFKIAAASNPLGIWLDPAPSPEEGPPLSRNALRNKKYLPAEIGGIVGAYLFTVVVLLLLFYLVGRPLRHKAAVASIRDIEMVSNAPPPTSPSRETKFWKTWRQSPATSPQLKSPRSWKTWGSNPQSPVKDAKASLTNLTPSSVATFDHQVIEEDKKKRAEDMDRLYAAVMAHDDARSKVALNESSPQLSSVPEPESRTPIPSPGLPKVSSPLASPRGTMPRPASEASKHSHTGSFASGGSRRKGGIRGLPISNPIHIPSYTQFMGGPVSPRSARSGRTGSISSPLSARRKSDEEPLTPGPRTGDDPINGNRIDEETQSFTSSRPSPSLPLRDHLTRADRTRVTVLERALARDPKSPRSGVPMTPYSPYMPFTPITPVTPRLVTKAERKAREKEEAKLVKEMTKSDRELFGSAW